MMRHLLFLPVVLLTLPAATCSRPEPGIEVRTVPVPTPVACVDREDLPDETPKTSLTGNARVDSGLLFAENKDLRAENGDLRALIVPGCLTVSD